MDTCHQPNSRLPRENEPIKDLRQVNQILKFLGLFPLGRVPTSKVTIYFWKKKTTVVIQPFTLWTITMVNVPDYVRLTFIQEEALIPDTGHMHITLIEHE